jgi:3-hydroxyisobutyrate dehydrogenase-like beta-hydroxyacid dehydrogenase
MVENTRTKVAIIGLGHMGSAMATRLLDTGHELVVFNRTKSKAEPFAARGAQVADTPADAAREADALVTMLADDAAVEHALLGKSGAAAALRPGCVHASMSTISPECSSRMAEIHEAAGQLYVAAPVMGRPEAAARGELVVIAAGRAHAREKIRPIARVLAKQIREVGDEPSRANVLKLGVNFALASILEVLGEAYALVESHGIDDLTFLEVLDELLKSPVIDAYGKRIAEDAFEPAGFRLSLGAKDVRLAVETGERAAVPMPLASTLRDRFVAAIAEGFGDDDWAAVGRASTARRYSRTAH